MTDLISPTIRRARDAAREDPEAYWDEAARALPWLASWDHVLEWTPPTFRWFTGARTNLCYQALDHHIASGHGGHAALIALEESGDRRVYTYAQLLHEVERIARGLRALGVGEGDRVAVYMPTNAEAIALMLACTRIGAVHLVVFAGFGAGALSERIRMAEAKVLFASDITYRRGNHVPLTGIIHDALEGEGASEVVEQVVMHRRGEGSAPVSSVPELDWNAFLAAGEGQDGGYVALDSNAPAYILATSGTTARPKLAVHRHGPYAVHVAHMARTMFDLGPQDVWWATSDIGWVVGHSYIVYAPLLIGATTISFEGALDYPDEGTLYRLLEEHRVTACFTSPTAIRMLMRAGVEPARRYNLDSVNRIFSAGEVLNPPAWEWFQKAVFRDHVPVIDHMWQTETGGPIIGNPYGLGMLPIKPGSSGVPLPGIEGRVVTPEGEPCAPGEKGIFVIERPFPGLISELWGEPERYEQDYWTKIPGQLLYFTGDAAEIDEDGYVWFSGRADEIIKIAAHRLGTIEVESAILRHPAVGEAGVTGRPDDLRGEVISAFVVLKRGYEASDDLRTEILQTIRAELGPIAVVGELNFVQMLPKTRSGKIMRRVLKAVTLDRDPGDVSTIEDEGSVEDARTAWEEMKQQIRGGS